MDPACVARCSDVSAPCPHTDAPQSVLFLGTKQWLFFLFFPFEPQFHSRFPPAFCVVLFIAPFVVGASSL